MQPRLQRRGPILDVVFEFVSFSLVLELCWWSLMQPRLSHRGPILEFVFEFVSFYLVLAMC